MALMFDAKLDVIFQTAKYFVYLFVYTAIKSLFSSRLRSTPSTPSKGDCFCLFPFRFQPHFQAANPIKALFLL